MTFSEENYKDILKLLKLQVLDFHTPGNGTVIRHDVDDRIDHSVRMAEIEHSFGVRSTYFILDTAPYWKEDHKLWSKLRKIQDMGHEIGWHNNAVTAWYNDQRRHDLRHYIEQPLKALRIAGLNIRLTASHGDPLCYILEYVNYNCFGFKSETLTRYNGAVYTLKEFGLVQDASHDPHTGYLSDSGGNWSLDPHETIMKWVEMAGKQRNQALFHPQHWQI